LIQEWILFIRQQNVRAHVIFLADYDMSLTEQLVQGVDVWINTPRRPWEACGTSGMKVLANGGINLSELDGWWAEAYTPDVGWALGDGLDHGVDPGRDALEAQALYDLLETAVIPEFYERSESGMPGAWIKRMRESMARLTPQFSANRAVREYTERHYLQAATAYRERAAEKGLIGRQIVDWRRALDQQWETLHFGSVRVNTRPGGYAIEAELYLNGIDPDAVRVQCCAEALHPGEDPVRLAMALAHTPTDSSHPHIYLATITSQRAASDYTARVIPHHAAADVPLECTRIAWQR
jgi:starch phosphorylase